MHFKESEIGTVPSKNDKSKVWGQLLLHPALISPSTHIGKILIFLRPFIDFYRHCISNFVFSFAVVCRLWYEAENLWQLVVILTFFCLFSMILDLTDRTYSVGRFPNCDFPISGQNVSFKGILKHISRKHFVLKKQVVSGLLIVHVTDFSFNGTFINGVRIGRNNTFTLFDGDSLAIGLPSFTSMYYSCNILIVFEPA